MSNQDKAVDAIRLRFKSGNDIPVDKAWIPASEWEAVEHLIESQRKELEESGEKWNKLLGEQHAIVAQVEAENVLLKRELEEAANAYLSLAVKYDCLANEHVTRGEQLKELREEVQAGNLSLGYANEIIAKCEQEIKQYRELCGELVTVLESANMDLLQWLEARAAILAKAKERLK